MERARAGHRRRWLVQLALVAAFVLVATGCLGTWGLRTSYRNYITSPIAHGEITTAEGVTWLDGTGTGKGPFQWPIESSEFDAGTETGHVQFGGTVKTSGHPTEAGSVLDTSFSNPRLEIVGDEGSLIVDLNYRPFAGTSPTQLAPLEAALDVPFATLDLSGVDWTPNANGWISIANAPTTGITAAMQMIGWDLFYGDPVVLDPFSVTFQPDKSPAMAADPTIVVSKTTDLVPGDTVTVWGSGFDPSANVGVRPLIGQASGVYAVFGRFLPAWKPSAGAPSTSRTVLSQKWALPTSSRTLLDPAGTSPAFVTIDEHGRFEATVDISEGGTAGSYGVYVYPGAGAVNAAHEHAHLVTLQTP